MPDTQEIEALKRELARHARFLEELRLDHLRLHGLRVESGTPANNEVPTWNSTLKRYEFATPSGTGAPASAEYVVLALAAGLAAERVLVASSPLQLTDGGAEGNATLSHPGTHDDRYYTEAEADALFATLTALAAHIQEYDANAKLAYGTRISFGLSPISAEAYPST